MSSRWVENPESYLAPKRWDWYSIECLNSIGHRPTSKVESNEWGPRCLQQPTPGETPEWRWSA